ncbi:MAG: ABC transporter ATP-binding protein [Deltaproteobacteria bacterium]|nr:ABC transporter ATP-binding protein [Deltaproteobacteria bacterium]MBW2070157.1 ABC transporter ATP-binding protein [Deltaproteobacteria bacterium]
MEFGGLTAVNEFSLALTPGELVGLIGPNGAGKTTVFNMITGSLVPTRGKVLFDGHDITGRKAHQITARGIARTFQNIRLFNDLTVFENLMVSFHFQTKSSFLGAVFRLPRYRRETEAARSMASHLLEEVGLQELTWEKAGALAYGQQRRLEIARALATRPKLILLDEPAAGMNPRETEALMDLIQKIRRDYNLTVLLIEHDMTFVMGICERLKVLDYGITIAEGLPEEIQNNERVIQAYLGERRFA